MGKAMRVIAITARSIAGGISMPPRSRRMLARHTIHQTHCSETRRLHAAARNGMRRKHRFVSRIPHNNTVKLNKRMCKSI
jgi:hypothetical protein